MFSYSQTTLRQTQFTPQPKVQSEPPRCGRVMNGSEKLLRMNWFNDALTGPEVAALSGYSGYKSALNAAHRLGLPPRNKGYVRKTKLARMLAAK